MTPEQEKNKRLIDRMNRYLGQQEVKETKKRFMDDLITYGTATWHTPLDEPSVNKKRT